MKNCVFCRIVAGELPCSTVYEDEIVLCFLDIAPLAPGHALIIPKAHHTSLTTLPAETAGHLMSVAPRIAQALTRAVKGDGFNLLLSNGACAGQVVPHTHLHLVPRSPNDGVILPTKTVEYQDEEQRDAILADARRRLQS